MSTRDPLPLLHPPPPWVEFALCAQTDPDAFYPEGNQSPWPAQRICARCPVRGKCLDWALDTGERHGVWGGKSPRQRRDLARRRAARPAA